MRKSLIPVFILAIAAMGFAVNAADPQLKDTKFGQWTLQTVQNYNPKTSEYPEHLIYVRGKNEKAQAGVEVMVFYAAEVKQWVVVFRFTPDHDAKIPLRLKFASGSEGPMPVESCNPNFCQTTITETDQLLQFFQIEKSAALVVTNKKGDKAEIPFSLDGFPKAFEELKKTKK